MSNINPQNIDGTFPIAGQDNNSQGFRDNFTNTINNFTFSAAELTDLQTYAVLKGPLGSVGQTGTPTNVMDYTYITEPQLLKAVETKKDIGTISSGSSFEVNWSQGHFQTVSIGTTAGMTFAATWPTSGLWTKLRLQVTATTLSNLTISGTYVENLSSIQGASGNVITLNTGVYVFDLTTHDAGAHVWIQDALRNYDNVAAITTSSLVTNGNVVIADPIGAGSWGSNLTIKGTIELKSQDSSNVYASSKSLTLSPGGDQFLLLNINGNCAIGYNAGITAGHQTTVHVQNSAGALAYVIVPNNNTNTGNAFIGLATGITGTFVFTSYGTTSANVFVTAIR